MKNRDIYPFDPANRKLVNEGVAKVEDSVAALRFELETFVCNGQYEKGIFHIVETFMKNIDQPQQPGVWISGFYGSGKSHLVKMLCALWTDHKFDDGATSREITVLPQSIKDCLKELSTQAKRHGGLHAASGLLGAAASGSVRLALLRIIFRSVGLPDQYPVARFVMWLQKEGIYDQVYRHVQEDGFDWNVELDNFYVAEGLHNALMKVKPELFTSLASCVDTLNNLYPYVKDIGSDEMVKVIKQALSRNGKLPLSLIILDEVQQYIGEDSQRSIDVQELVETCSKGFGGKLLFVGTGQTAVTGTSNLKKLEGRFTIRIELSDSDVDAVVRHVILAKKADAKNPIEHVMQTNLGEISRHLNGTTIGHRQNDVSYFSQDYPILPVRRRFWESTLRVLDQTGTDSQLRNQLSMIHKAIQTNLDNSLGYVIPADYLYFDAAEKLLQTRILPRKVHEKTMSWIKGSEDERLSARACGLVFLINKLAGHNKEIGIHANVDVLADLMIEDLASGSAVLRGRLPALLDKCQLLIKVGDEYRIQTEESAAWNDEFLGQRSSLSNEVHRIDAERDDRIRKKLGELLRKFNLQHGSVKEPRDVELVFDSHLPTDANQKICVWVRDEWSSDENSVKADARQAGNTSPTVFVFIPKRSADALRHNLIDYKAALATLDRRGAPNTPEGTEARAAMETIKSGAESKIRELLDEAFAGARVFQGGGSEIHGIDLLVMIQDAAKSSLQRLYPQFAVADNPGWAKVYEKAQKGDPAALKSVNDDGEPVNNPVCKTIVAFIGAGKKGAEIRAHFESAPYGWSRDAVDGALTVLVVSGAVRARDERGQSIDIKELERKAIGKTSFKVEASTISAGERIKIRKLLQKAGVEVKPQEELSAVPDFLTAMQNYANFAGGDAPKPIRPDTSVLDEIGRMGGNEQLKAICNVREDLEKFIEDCIEAIKKIEARRQPWELLTKLIVHVDGLPDSDVISAQIDVIRQQRLLIAEPDLVTPLLKNLTQLMRDELNRLKDEWTRAWQEGEALLTSDANWKQLEPEQQAQLRDDYHLDTQTEPVFKVGTAEDILSTMNSIHTFTAFRDSIAAMKTHFEQALLQAAKIMEPEARAIKLPSRTLKSAADVEQWLDESKQILLDKIKDGPLIV